MPIYSDINIYNPTNKPLVKDVEAIYQSLHSLFSTRLGQRLFNPEYGSELSSNLFELVDETTALAIFSEVVGAVERWEPRVRINYGQTQVIPVASENKFEVKLSFEISGNAGQQFEFTGSISS